MYKKFDKVLKKNTQFGVRHGHVMSAWTSGETEMLRVCWEDINSRSTCKADSVLPNTPENRAALEAKRQQHLAWLDAKYNKVAQ